jgi:hypothetical protein
MLAASAVTLALPMPKALEPKYFVGIDHALGVDQAVVTVAHISPDGAITIDSMHDLWAIAVLDSYTHGVINLTA